MSDDDIDKRMDFYFANMESEFAQVWFTFELLSPLKYTKPLPTSRSGMRFLQLSTAFLHIRYAMDTIILGIARVDAMAI